MEGTLDPGYARLCAVAHETLGLQLDSYRSRQLERRLGFFRQRLGLGTNAELAARLRIDAALQKEFADFVTINVSEFFRNRDRFSELQNRYLPALRQRRPSLRVWSAGCSIGAELYSVTLLLQGIAPGQPHELLGTDIDAASLARATAGIYQPHEVRELPDAMLKRFFRPTAAGWELSPLIRSLVQFRRHDLLRDPFPAAQDLIICRNVVIYFTEDAKAQLYRRFHAALRPGGLLFIGATETLFEAGSLGLRYLGPGFYEKAAGAEPDR